MTSPPNPEPNSITKTSPSSGRRASTRSGRTRRAVLVGVGAIGLSSLAGCLGLFGAEPVNAEQDGTPDGSGQGQDGGDRIPTSTTTSDSGGGESNGSVNTPDSDLQTSMASGPPTGPGVMPADVRPSPGKPKDESFEPLDRVYVGPITSPATNSWDRDVDDPAPEKKLVDVTVRNSVVEDWIVSPPYTHHRMDGLELTVNRDGTFTAEGGLHYHNKCGYFGINHLYVEGNTATIFLAYGYNPACSDSEIGDGKGYWYGPVSVTGRLVGNFDTFRFVLLNGNQNLGEFSPTDTMEFEV